MNLSMQPEPPSIGDLDVRRVLRRLAYWLGYEMREYDEEWAAAIDIRGYCRLAIWDTARSDVATLDNQEIALAAHVVRAYRHTGHKTSVCARDSIGVWEGDALYYLPALREVVRRMGRGTPRQ